MGTQPTTNMNRLLVFLSLVLICAAMVPPRRGDGRGDDIGGDGRGDGREPTHVTAHYGPRSYSLRIQTPAVAMEGGSPLYMWTDGTGMAHDDPADDELLAYMASKGFVAVSVQWDNSDYSTWDACPGLEVKAEAIFSSGDADSALSVLCAMQDVDCAKGVAVHGFSQGAQLSALAAGHSDLVTAALLFANGNDVSHGIMQMECLSDSEISRSIPQERRRSIIGVNDGDFNTQGSVKVQQVATTGMECSSSNCLQVDGSGYFIIDSETCPECDARDQFSHCFFYPCTRDRPSLYRLFEDTCEPWGMKAGLDWLASTASGMNLHSSCGASDTEG